MNYIKSVKVKKVGFILALVFVLALSAGPCTAFGAGNQLDSLVAAHYNPDGTINLEMELDEPILPPAPILNPTYSITGAVITDNSEEAAVIAIQQKLVSLGYDTGGIDGIYGPKTREAVMLFQASRNLIVDGIVGPQTLAALGFIN